MPKTTKNKKQKLQNSNMRVMEESDCTRLGKLVNQTIDNKFKYQDKLNERAKTDLSILKMKNTKRSSKYYILNLL